MRKFGYIGSAILMLVVGVAPAAAQDAQKVGVTVSTGTTVGIYVPAGDQVAIRAQIAFNRHTSKYDGANFVNETVTNTTWSPGASVLFFVKAFDATRIYVSPQYGYARSSSSVDNAGKNTGHQVAGMVGAQHQLGSRLAIFAEAGLGWSRSKNASSSALSTSTITSTAWSTRSAIGGILFF